MLLAETDVKLKLKLSDVNWIWNKMGFIFWSGMSPMQVLEQHIRASFFRSRWQHISERDIAVLLIAVFLQLLFVWLFKWHRGLYLWCGRSLADITSAIRCDFYHSAVFCVFSCHCFKHPSGLS